eukprot:TRINITY_DN121359_c0_g1_i1.p1 TRINITY_DN121359_c0_g1~~TRINITY_DN121359_c0_g1_i1.p1  ORF type:complete len:276 (+),score=54.82 TRINITY_DN121359_c0_g1_i1:63-890(+)
MAEPNFASQLFGTLGIVAALCLFLSPVPTCRRVLKERSTLSFSVLPYLAQMVESSWWALWAVAAGDRLEMLLNNGIGATINFFYVAIFFALASAEHKRRLRVQVAFGSFLVGIAALIAVFVEDPDTIFGVAAVTLNTLKYASPLSVARMVIVTQSVEFMPLPLTLASLACGIFWGLHGAFLQDVFIYLPNIAGVAFALVQVCLYIRYGVCGPRSAIAEGGEGKADLEAAEAPETPTTACTPVVPETPASVQSAVTTSAAASLAADADPESELESI